MPGDFLKSLLTSGAPSSALARGLSHGVFVFLFVTVQDILGGEGCHSPLAVDSN